MLDSLESFVRNHYISTAWNEDRHYSNITASSRAILDFEVPRGIELRLGKSLSPYFRTAYSWGIIPDRKSFGVIFSNVSSLDTLRWPIARAGGAGAGSVTEDIQTRLGLSWREAVQHYDHVKHLPKDSHGDSKIRRDDALWPKKTSRSRDAAPSVWSWERMVALATGQPVDQRQIHNDQLGDRADSASQITSETLASLSAIGAARGPRQTNDHVPSLGNKKASPRDTLLYGQLLQDGSIDFQYSQRLHRNWLAIASGRSAWQYANSHVGPSRLCVFRLF